MYRIKYVSLFAAGFQKQESLTTENAVAGITKGFRDDISSSPTALVRRSGNSICVRGWSMKRSAVVLSGFDEHGSGRHSMEKKNGCSTLRLLVLH